MTYSAYEDEDDELERLDLGAGFAHDTREFIFSMSRPHDSDEKVTDLLVRYWGLGKKLDEDEKEILLVALDEENKLLMAPIHRRALARLKEKGIT